MRLKFFKLCLYAIVHSCRMLGIFR